MISLHVSLLAPYWRLLSLLILPLHGIAWQCTMQCGKWTVEYFHVGALAHISLILRYNAVKWIPQLDSQECTFPFLLLNHGFLEQSIDFRLCHDWTLYIYSFLGRVDTKCNTYALLPSYFIVFVDSVFKRPIVVLYSADSFCFLLHSHFEGPMFDWRHVMIDKYSFV